MDNAGGGMDCSDFRIDLGGDAGGGGGEGGGGGGGGGGDAGGAGDRVMN